MLSSLLLSRSVRLVILGAGLTLAACGGSTSTPSDDGTTPGGGTPAATATSPTSPATPSKPSTPTPIPTVTATATTPPAPTTPPKKPPVPGACNAINNDAASIGAQMIAANPPAATGGVVASGKYHLTDISLYTGPGGGSGPLALAIQQTLVINAGTVDVIQTANGKTETTTETFTTSGTTASFGKTCPTVDPVSTAQFSANGVTLMMYLPNDVGQIAAYTYSP